MWTNETWLSSLLEYHYGSKVKVSSVQLVLWHILGSKLIDNEPWPLGDTLSRMPLGVWALKDSGTEPCHCASDVILLRGEGLAVMLFLAPVSLTSDSRDHCDSWPLYMSSYVTECRGGVSLGGGGAKDAHGARAWCWDPHGPGLLPCNYSGVHGHPHP